jgi:hypothetical protein
LFIERGLSTIVANYQLDAENTRKSLAGLPIFTMMELALILLVAAAVYLLIAAYLYIYQRRLIYYPVAHDADFTAPEITIDNEGTLLHGWVLNPDRDKALIYFGGNSELLTHRSGYFEDVLPGQLPGLRQKPGQSQRGGAILRCARDPRSLAEAAPLD